MTMSAASGEDQQLASEDFETNTKKSERKRQREKQRRSDLASAFEELASLLSEIEPEEDVGGGRTKKSRRRSGPGEAPAREVDQLEALGMTRLDLIGRTIETLRRLHRENSDLRQSLEHQSHRAEGDDKEVLVMVPTLAPSDDRSHHSPGTAYAMNQAGPYNYYGHQQGMYPDYSSQGHGTYYQAPPPQHHYYGWGNPSPPRGVQLQNPGPPPPPNPPGQPVMHQARGPQPSPLRMPHHSKH